MLSLDVDPLNHHFAELRIGLQDLTNRSFLFASDNLNCVAFLHMHSVTNWRTCLIFACHYSTSGARETILVKFLSRSSRATGPNTRVPLGLPSALIMTAALSSNRMLMPLSRLSPFLVRTITARTISDFLTAMLGIASLTTAIMTSPTPP